MTASAGSCRAGPVAALAAASRRALGQFAPRRDIASPPAPQARHRHARRAGAWPPDFDHLRYVNPTAPKGGRLTHGVLGTFDSLNPFIVKGLAPAQIRGYVVESLLARGYDEPFTLYGLLARSVETDAERSYVTFALDPAAKFSDGKPVTADDVIFSWQLLRDKGRPNFRTYYVKVAKAEALSEREVRFDLTGADDRELPLILGLMPVLAKHAVDPETFEDTTLEPIDRQRPLCDRQGRRRPQRHAQARSELLGARPRRSTAASGISTRSASTSTATPTRTSRRSRRACYDVRAEHDPGRWETAYDVPAVRDGRIVKEAFPTGLPKGMSGLVFNTRRPIFADIRRARGDRRCCSTSNGSTTISSSTATSAPRAISRARNCRRAAGPPMRASARCSRPFPTPCAPT